MIKPFTEDDFYASGNTALLDAVSDAIDNIGNSLSAMNEASRPSKVIFTIITDGEENASRHTTKAWLSEKIKHQESKYNWTFIYLGANQDAFTNAQSIGITDITYVKSWDSTAEGTRALYTTTSALNFVARGESTANS